MRLLIAVALLLVGCAKDDRRSPEMASVPMPVGNPCGTKIIEPFGDLAPGSILMRSVDRFDPVKGDTLSVAYAVYGPPYPVYVASIGVMDSTFSYTVNGSSVTLENKSAVLMSYYVAALVHDCY